MHRVSRHAPHLCRLLNAFAEENAIQDAIYYLSEALQKGVIDLDHFLKVSFCTTSPLPTHNQQLSLSRVQNVRDLSRKQFMLKALMQKCREKAGLPC